MLRIESKGEKRLNLILRAKEKSSTRAKVDKKKEKKVILDPKSKSR